MGARYCTVCKTRIWGKGEHDGLIGGNLVCSHACALKSNVSNIAKGTGQLVGEVGGVAASMGKAGLSEGVGTATNYASQIGGVAMQGTARVAEEGGLLAGATMGTAMFLGPGLTAVLAFCAGEVWAIVIGVEIFDSDWLMGIIYFLTTGFGLILATIIAMLALIPVIYAPTLLRKDKLAKSQRRGMTRRALIQARVKTMSGTMIAAALVMDLIMGLALLGGLFALGWAG